MKVILFQLLLVASALTAFSSVRASGNKYEVLARTIAPIVELFVPSGPNKAARAEFTLEALTGAPSKVLGKSIRLAIQTPDRLSISGEIFNEEITLCRDQQRVWAAPGRSFRALLLSFGPLPRPEPEFAMGKFGIPLPPAQITLLPALFIVQERAGEEVDGVPCRTLALKLMPEISRNLKIENWSAEMWITPDLKPARLRLARPGWEIVLGIREVQYLPGIPSSEWKPPAGETDVFYFNADRLSQFMQLIEQKLMLRDW
jgi:hypothetical protein